MGGWGSREEKKEGVSHNTYVAYDLEYSDSSLIREQP